jgi:hypothetical protein
MDVNNELVLQYDINYNGIKIHQTTIDEMYQYGIEEYNKLLLPYYLTLDIFQIPPEEHDNYSIFDLICINEDIFFYLILSLRYFCKTDNITTESDGIHVDGGVINRNNFEEFSQLILKIHAKEREKEEKLPDNPRQRELELKLRALRARHKPKNEIQLCDIMNIVKFGGKYHISINEIRQMTLWNLTMAYKAKVGVSNWEDSLSIALVSGDKENKLDDVHWIKQLKVDN